VSGEREVGVMAKNSSTELPKSNPEAMIPASLLFIRAVPPL
jgi:hypothetical protein